MVLACDARNVNWGKDGENGSELENSEEICKTKSVLSDDDAEFKLLVNAKKVLLEHRKEYDLYLSMKMKISFQVFIGRYKNVAKASMHFADVRQQSLE